MYCGLCGHLNPPDASHCSECSQDFERRLDTGERTCGSFDDTCCPFITCNQCQGYLALETTGDYITNSARG